MHKRLLTLLSILCLLGSIIDASAKIPGRSIWVWENDVATNAKKRQDFFEFAAHEGITRVHIESAWLITGAPELLGAFIDEAHTHLISVDLLMGAADWVRPEKQNIPVHLAHAVSRFALARSKAGKVLPVSVQLDVEPYTLPEWVSPNDSFQWKTSARRYLNLLSLVRNALINSGVQLTAAIPFWYDSLQLETSNQGTRPLSELVLDSLDGAAIMAYRHDPHLIISFSQSELDYAKKTGKSIMVGTLFSCSEEENQSFCTKNIEEAQPALNQVSSAFADNPAFEGIALHDYRSLNHFK